MKLPSIFRPMRMGIVVHSYGHRWNSKVQSQKYPGFVDALDLIAHCHEIGAGGVQVMVRGWTSDFANKVRDRREKFGLFLEGSIGLPGSTDDLSRFQQEIIAAQEAGASIVRAVCLSGRRYENFKSLEAFEDFTKNSIASLERAEPVVRKNKIKLAIENHKDWRAPELKEVLKNLSSEWVGVNLDFGNNIALVEDPMEVVETLAPYTFTTHVKDMGVLEYPEGFLLSEVPLGEGFLDLKKMFDVCKEYYPEVNFNLEMITRDPLKIPCLTDGYWSTFPSVAPKELASTLRMVRQHPFRTSLPAVDHLEPEQILAAEEKNILTSLQYSKARLGMR
jgi:sugar phosphate isomerase/epimerase